jgi:hypothetical protein
MALLYFLAALLGIALLAILVNRATGTKASYIEALQLEPGELQLWRDEAADVATLPRFGQAAVTSFPRLRRHVAVWTTQRLIVAERALGSSRHMVTHQLLFEAVPAPALAPAREAAGKFAAGFYGRGFETLLVTSHSFSRVDDKDCVRLVLSGDSSAVSNVIEAYLFSDRLAELTDALHQS